MTRKQAETLFGEIKIYYHCPPIPDRSNDYEAYFDRFLDVGMPSWTRAFGASADIAVAALLVQAAEHFDEMRIDDLLRRSGCNDL